MFPLPTPNDTQPRVRKFCGVCYAFGDRVDLKFCNGCKGIWYCSEECQIEDQDSHKVLCKLFADTEKPADDTAVREGIPAHHVPSRDRSGYGDRNGYDRVIYFHPEKDKPEILWRPRGGYVGEAEWFKNWDDEEPPPMKKVQIGFDADKAKSCQTVLWVDCRASFEFDGSQTNIPLAMALSAGGEMTLDWRGPVLLSRLSGDIDMADYRRGLQFMREYGSMSENDPRRSKIASWH